MYIICNQTENVRVHIQLLSVTQVHRIQNHCSLESFVGENFTIGTPK
jgi:hypothetical protein